MGYGHEDANFGSERRVDLSQELYEVEARATGILTRPPNTATFANANAFAAVAARSC